MKSASFYFPVTDWR